MAAIPVPGDKHFILRGLYGIVSLELFFWPILSRKFVRTDDESHRRGSYKVEWVAGHEG